MSESRLQTITDPRTGESCVRIDHPSGLPIFVWPKAGYTSCYAVFATRYGSIDTAFRMDGAAEDTVVPAGIAHFLEHKLFENEDCDAFARYAKTGASANAYTSFDRTAYLFTCTDRVEESLDILLDFVQSPYFTKETVEKEQGIIGQEIRMCEDSPSRRVLFNLLKGLYARHPVRIDIAGTVESIAGITPELLYGCYHTFYNLHNMVLCVTGNVTPEQVLAAADRQLKPAPPWGLERAVTAEPPAAVQPRVEDTMPVASPLFYLGFKERFTQEDGNRCRTPQELIAAEVLTDLLVGRASPLYASLMERGLINANFSADYWDGPGYAVWLFGGESADPDTVAAEIQAEIARQRAQGLDEKAFAAARNAVYGRLIAAMNDVENCGDMLLNDYFYQRKPFALIDAAATLDIQSVYALLQESLQPEAATLSVVRPPQTSAGV